MPHVLTKNSDGRFECEGFVLHSGDSVELWVVDRFTRCRIESFDGKYYAILPLGGMRYLSENETARNPRGRFG